MTTLNEQEREALEIALDGGRVYDDVPAVVASILTARLARVERERDLALSAADSMQHFADVAEVCERKSNTYAARLAKVETLADARDVPFPKKWSFGAEDNYVKGYRAHRDALRAALASDPTHTQDGAQA